MNENELTHYGVKGMRWGHRKSSLNGTKKAFDESGNILRSMRDIDNTSRNIKRRKSKDLSAMSDTELRTVITRINLEKNYANLTAEPVSRGRQFISDFLDVGVSVASIGASSAAIAIAFKKLKD